jgi:hypothetical protein
MQRAHAQRLAAGRIHHDPRTAERSAPHAGLLRVRDWTDGCIAVTNADMVEIWMTSDNVRIDIQP